MQIVIPTPPDFSFGETLSAYGWRRLPPFVWDEEGQTLEHVGELDGGQVVLLRLRGAEGRVTVDVDGSTGEAEATRRVKRMLQLDLPLDGFHAYCRSRPELSRIAMCRQGRMLRCPTLFEDTLKAVCKVS